MSILSFHNKMTDIKFIKSSCNDLQLYARASAPCRDYYGLTVSEFCFTLNIWKISYGRHTTPKQKFCCLEDFENEKAMQEEIKNVFGEGVLDYLTGLSKKLKKLENLPTHLFLHLLLFLNMDDILRLMCCSKIMYELCNREEVWRLMFIKKFGRKPSKEEYLLALDYSWKEVFKKRLAYVKKMLKESNERRLKKMHEMRKITRKIPVA